MSIDRESLRRRPTGRFACRLALVATLGLAVGLSLPALAQRGGGGHGGGGGGRGGGGGSHGGGGGRGGSGYHAPSGGRYSAPRSGGYSGYRGYSSAPPRSTYYRGAYGRGYYGHGSYGRGGYGHGYYGHGYYGHGYYGHGWWGYPYWYGWGWYPWSLSAWWWWGGPWWGWGWGWGGYPYGAVAYGGYDGYGYDVPRGPWGIVKTDVEPEEAEVWLDGRDIGQADEFDGTPDFLYLRPGKYKIEFRIPNYQSLALDVEIKRGEVVRFDQKLKLEPGKSALDAFPPASKGTPSGRFFGPGGQIVSPGEASAGSRYSGEGEGYGTEDQPGRTTVREERPRYEAGPPRDRGRLRFSVTPEDAAIYVDDRYVGVGEELNNSRRGVIVDAGKRSVTISRPGFKSKTLEVEAKAGQPIDVVVDLEKQTP